MSLRRIRGKRNKRSLMMLRKIRSSQFCWRMVALRGSYGSYSPDILKRGIIYLTY